MSTRAAAHFLLRSMYRQPLPFPPKTETNRFAVKDWRSVFAGRNHFGLMRRKAVDPDVRITSQRLVRLGQICRAFVVVHSFCFRLCSGMSTCVRRWLNKLRSFFCRWPISALVKRRGRRARVFPLRNSNRRLQIILANLDGRDFIFSLRTSCAGKALRLTAPPRKV